jgi:hypothetical protein
MEAVETAGGSPATGARGATTPVRSGSRRRHLWSRKSKSEPEKDQAARRAAAASSVSSASSAAMNHQHVRDNYGYTQDPNSTGTGSPMISLRMRNAAVQCILLVDGGGEVGVNAGSSAASTAGSVTSSSPSSSSSGGYLNAAMLSSSPQRQRHVVAASPPGFVTPPSSAPRLVHQTTARGIGDDLTAYRTAVQYQRRKAIALANGEEETLLTPNVGNCVG